MILRRMRRFGVAAWLGLGALGMQILLPLLVSTGIEIAAARSAEALPFPICHNGQIEPGPGDSNHPGAPGPHNAIPCGHCLACAAAGGFTAPAFIGLSLPARMAERLRTESTPHTAPIFAAAAYLSRAPPPVIRPK